MLFQEGRTQSGRAALLIDRCRKSGTGRTSATSADSSATSDVPGSSAVGALTTAKARLSAGLWIARRRLHGSNSDVPSGQAPTRSSRRRYWATAPGRIRRWTIVPAAFSTSSTTWQTAGVSADPATTNAPCRTSVGSSASSRNVQTRPVSSRCSDRRRCLRESRGAPLCYSTAYGFTVSKRRQS